MIITVVVTPLDPRRDWQMELLEYSWRDVGQNGELLRLVSAPGEDALPVLHITRAFRTIPWNPHPYTGDEYAGYDMAASMLEWLYCEAVDASVVLLEPTSIFLSPISREVEPGTAVGNPWPSMPIGGSAPFGLDDNFAGMKRYFQNPGLKLDPVQFPAIIHSSDLKKIAPRWLELTSLIRSTVGGNHASDAVRLAYVIAAAEFGIEHEPASLGCSIRDSKLEGSVIDYAGPLPGAEKNKGFWSSEDYQPWESPVHKKPATKPGRRFLAYLKQYCAAREAGLHLRRLVPIRNSEVKEATVLDQVILKVPGLEDDLSLNDSAAAIWKLIDNNRSLSEMGHTLEEQHGLPPGAIWQDLDSVVHYLQSAGAITINAPSSDPG